MDATSVSYPSRPRLLLLTTHFPFGKGEEFLETEIDYLARYFDVMIVPWFPDNDFHTQRPLPSHVTIRTDIARAMPAGYGAALVWLFHHPRAATILGEWLLRSDEKFAPGVIKARSGFFLQALRLGDLLSNAFRSAPVDIVYSYWLSPAALAGALMKLRGTARVAISRAHGIDLYHDRSPVSVLPGQARTVCKLDRIICISEHGASYLRQHYPAHQNKIELSRLGVRAAPVRNTPSQDSSLHLVSCAYLSSIKRIDLLVKALSLCDIPIAWTHLGGGGLEEEISALAKELPGNIQWRITGAIPNSAILRFYQENPVDLFVNVSASEGLPVSIMEALSYGVPVAATDVGGNRELVYPDRNGILWPADVTPLTICQTLTGFFQMSQSRKRALRDAAWQVWADRVNAEVQYPAFVRLLLSLIAS